MESENITLEEVRNFIKRLGSSTKVQVEINDELHDVYDLAVTRTRDSQTFVLYANDTAAE